MGWNSAWRRLAALGTVVGLGISTLVAPVAAAPSTAGGIARPASPPEGNIPDLAALGWQAVLNEQFNGTSLDTTLWERDQSPGYTAAGVLSQDTVSVTSGNLELRTYTDAAGHHSGAAVSGALGPHNPTWSGFDFTYGYVEARMLFPDGPDTSSTFWMMSNNGNNSLPFGDPGSDGPELDIVEHANRPATGPYDGDADDNGNCDWPATSTVPCSETFLAGGHWDGFEEDHKPMHSSAVQNPNPSASLQGNFHTYGMLWTPREYRYFVDGIEVKRVTAGQTFHPEWLIIQTYVKNPSGHDYGSLGDPANDVTLVDYVKVWQRPISDVPDQSTAATTPLAVPFTVQDYFSSSPGAAEPGVVNVSATSSNTALVPNSSENLAVAGNAPSDPDGGGPLEATDGSFTNGGFESGSNGWALTGATVSGGDVHTGSQALHLPEGGGEATQTITALRPNTTYLVGAHYETDLAFDDANSNGRVDPGETFAVTGDRTARFDWGVQDVDSARAGDQEVRVGYTRNGWTEPDLLAWWIREPWPHELVKFTTGPTTTAVTLFFDNTPYVGQQDDSVVHVDDVQVRPVMPPQRTLAVRPAEGQVGQTTITLTASDASGTTIGTDTFTLSVGAGTLRDGGFEAPLTTTPWELATGAPRFVVPQPFQVDQQLELASSGADTVVQRVSNLEANTRYQVDVTGRASASGGEFAAVVQNYGGSQVGTTITSTTSTTQSFEFVTGASDTTADLLILDWDPADGSSFVENVRLSKCSTSVSCTTLATAVPWSAPPDLSTVGVQSGASGLPLNIGAQLPVGAELTSVTSTNEVLVPNVDIAATGPGRRKAFTVDPVQDRTGKTDIRVSYTGAAGSPVDIPMIVSDGGFLQPGFEPGWANPWSLTGTATVVTSGQRSGLRGLEINGTGEASQAVSGLPHAAGFVLGGWIDGTATVTLRTVAVEPGERPEDLATANWTGSGWTEQALPFTTLQCTDCTPDQWRPVEIVLSDTDSGDGQAVRVDDLYLVHRPVIRRQRDLSLHSQQTAYDWRTRREIAVGRVHENALWDPAVASVTSSDIPGFGTGVVPTSNIDGPKLAEHGWPFEWSVETKAGTTTGRSDVTLTLTDPATGHQTRETFAVTVNAGDNFNNGDFERSSLGALGTTGWVNGWFTPDHEIARRQSWQYLGIPQTGSEIYHPRDDGHALRISSGAVRHLITGLEPDTQYTVKFRAKGQGSTVQVKESEDFFAPVLQGGSVAISPPNTDNVWRDYELTFTTTDSEGQGVTSAVLYVIDQAPSPRTSRYCALFPTDVSSTPEDESGETCLDDIGIFKTSDL